MTKEELRAHCEKQVKMCEEWAKGNDREPSGKIYEEHKLILDLIKALEQQPSDDCVSRKAVIDMAKSYNTDGWDSYTPLVVDVEDIEELPPVTPTQCIATVRFSKEDLREICNERIKIECTHGTCKDCKHYYMDEDGCGYHCERIDYTRFSVYADFYCAGFEKRGNENER